MKKYLITLALAITATMTLSAANLQRITLKAKSFSSIVLNCAADIKLCQKPGSAGMIVYHIAPEIKDKIHFIVKNGTLECTTDRGVKLTKENISRITIFANSPLKRVAVNGSGDISCSPLKAKDVNANCSGSGDITCHASESITAKTELSGEITCHGNPSKKNLSGRTKNIHIK